jgi:hypothetical protein
MESVAKSKESHFADLPHPISDVEDPMSDGPPKSMPDRATPASPEDDPRPESPLEVWDADRPTSLGVWGTPAAIGFAYLCFWQIVPRIQTESNGAILFSTLVALGIIIWFNAQIARGFQRPWQFAASLLITAACIIPLQIMSYLGKPVAPWSWLVVVRGLPHLLLVWLASSLGGLLSFLLRGANMIPPVAAVLALVDIWTVFLGPVGKMMRSDNPTAQKITSALTVPLPAPTKTGASPISPTLVIGFADFLFIAFFVAAISRFVPGERPYRRMLAVLIGLLSAYMLVVYFSGWNLPALLPLAVVMLALHWRHFQYSRSEMFAMLYAGLFILLIGAGFWYMNQHFVIPPKPALP